MLDDKVEEFPEGAELGPAEGWERLWFTPVSYALAVLIAVAFVAPLVWMFATSLRPVGLPPATRFELIPPALSLDNYPLLFDIQQTGRFLRNSILVVAMAVPLTLLVASLAGFALSQITPRIRGIIVAISVAAMLVPAIALWTTRFLVYKWVGILDTPLALIAPVLMGTSPLFVLMYAWAFGRVPKDIFEQALLDGAHPWRIWWTVALPLVRPITTGVIVLSAVFYWSDFINPLLYVNNQEWYTMAVGLQALQQMDRTNWPLLMTGSVLLTLPVLLLFIVAQRYFFQEERQRGWIGQ